ncbi:MAG: hypothetical protein EXS36_06730 [Pedosphaera sp.]|nr:hypothetical protein [Pedosphaera sp.]
MNQGNYAGSELKGYAPAKWDPLLLAYHDPDSIHTVPVGRYECDLDRSANQGIGLDTFQRYRQSNYLLSLRVEAARDANGAPGFGAFQRFVRAHAHYSKGVTEERCEGIVGNALRPVAWSWRRALPGSDANLPFRVTGVVWGD